MDCYAEDVSRHAEILPLLRNLIPVTNIEPVLVKHARLLTRLDPAALVLFVAVNKPHMMETLVNALEPASKEEYRVVEAIVELA